MQAQEVRTYPAQERAEEWVYWVMGQRTGKAGRRSEQAREQSVWSPGNAERRSVTPQNCRASELKTLIVKLRWMGLDRRAEDLSARLVTRAGAAGVSGARHGI